MFYVKLGECQENTTGRTPSKPLKINKALINYSLYVVKLVYTNNTIYITY
jgi:hypothetical protein